MYVGKVWTLEQEGHECNGMQMECIDFHNKNVKGEYLYWYRNGKCFKEEILTMHYGINHFRVICIDPKFWTGTIKGEPVRCYETKNGDTRLYWIGNKQSYWYLSDEHNMPEAIHNWFLSAIKDAGIPIMPYGQSNGNYESPKTEEKNNG